MTKEKEKAVLAQWLGKKVPKNMWDEVQALLPPDIHVAPYDGIVKYRVGRHPNTRAVLETPKAIAARFQKGQSGNQGNRTHHRKKRLQGAFQELLEKEVEGYKIAVDGTVKRDRKTMVKVSKLLAQMQLDALKRAFEKGFEAGNLNVFSRLLGEFRIAAGEIPTQETDNKHEVTSSGFENATVGELVKVVGLLAERVANAKDPKLFEKPKTKEIEARITTVKNNKNK